MVQAAGGVAIVTGAGNGIGRATVLALVEDGWRIVAVDRDADKIAETGGIVGSAVATLVGDVADPATAEAAVALAQERFGPLTGLVNCAAVRVPGRITDVTAEQWRTSFAVTVDGVFNFCKAAIPAMQAAGGGSIVNISSPSAYGRKKLVAYSSTKAAVNVLSACLAADHLEDRIRVNVVIPPFTLTGMTEDYPQDKLRIILDQTPTGRASTPEEIAAMVRYLMSTAGEGFTGGVFGSLPVPSF